MILGLIVFHKFTLVNIGVKLVACKLSKDCFCVRRTSLFKRPILLNDITKLTNYVFRLEFQDFVRRRQDIERSFKLVVDYLISDHEPLMSDFILVKLVNWWSGTTAFNGHNLGH